MWWLWHNFIIHLQQIAVDILAYYAGVYQFDRVKSCKCAFSQWNKKNVQEIIAQNDRTFYFKLNSLFDGLTDICGCFAIWKYYFKGYQRWFYTFLRSSACLSFSSISSLVLRPLFFFLFSSFLRCWGLLFTLPVSGQSITSNEIPPLLCGLSVTPPIGEREFILFLTSSCFSEKETLLSFKLLRLVTLVPSMLSSGWEKTK